MVAIAAPRSHGKSTAITHAYVLANILFRERRFILIVSDTETQAINFLGDIREELTNNDDIANLFGIKGFIKETETDIVIEFNDGYTCRVLTRGAEQRVRGLKWNQIRPDLIVCDDLEGDEQVLNKERREKFKRWFYGALLPCRSQHGIVRIVGTILHLDSLLNQLMPSESSSATIKEPLKSYSKYKKVAWRSVRYRAHDEEFVNILWPTRYEKEFFQNLKEDYTNRGMPEIYAQEYLNYPIDESTSYFKRSDFTEMQPADYDTEKVYYIGADLAVSTKDRSDYTVLAVMGVDSSGMMHVVDIRKGRWDSLQIVDEIFAVQIKYKPDLFIIERGTIEKAIGPILRTEMLSRNVYLNLHPMTPTTDKMSRARSIQARMRSGGIKFDKDAEWYADLEDELVRFPKTRHDDQVDALAWIGLTLDTLQVAMSDEEIEEQEYQEMYGSEYDNGRNLTCGY